MGAYWPFIVPCGVLLAVAWAGSWAAHRVVEVVLNRRRRPKLPRAVVK